MDGAKVLFCDNKIRVANLWSTTPKVANSEVRFKVKRLMYSGVNQ